MKEFGKTDVRYWKDRVYRRNRGKDENGKDITDSNWTAQMQYCGRREQFPLGTPNGATAAIKARDIYLSLQSKGWEVTLAKYKPQFEEPKGENATVGDLIREIGNCSNFRATTLSTYCVSLRQIVAYIGKVKSGKEKFAPGSEGNRKWREKVESVPMAALTDDAVQQWKLSYLRPHLKSPADLGRATNSVNAHIRNARSLFTPRALEHARRNLTLPDPLPFSKVKLEKRRIATRYKSRIDAEALLRDAKSELYEVPDRSEMFKIFCLGLLCGMRKREIDTLLWTSVDFEKSVIRIEETKYFRPKSEESSAEIDLAPELVTIFKEYQKKAAGEFVVESENEPRYHISRHNFRAERDFKSLYAWLNAKGVSALKKLHELRKECGSVIANSLGIFAASRALRHSDIRITSQYYSDKKVRITTGLDSILKRVVKPTK